MNYSKMSTRLLPREILAEPGLEHRQLEALAVKQKFSNPDAHIGEFSSDYAAFFYMTPSAILFWLPRYIDYLKDAAKRDSYHFESLIYKLSKPQFTSTVVKEATQQERQMVIDYLDWWEATLLPVEKDDRIYGASLEVARKLWSATD